MSNEVLLGVGGDHTHQVIADGRKLLSDPSCWTTPRSPTVRAFPTGATRDTEEGKLDYRGFCSALARKRFAEYMHHHRHQGDGTLRAADNWKRGIDLGAYHRSVARHVQDLDLHLEGFPQAAEEPDLEVVLCAIWFNVQGMLHEVVKGRMLEGEAR